MFKGIFKKTPKPFARTQSQVRVVRLTCLTCICITYLYKANNNDDILCGIFVYFLFFCLQDDLSAPSELSGSTDNLSVNTNTKVK